MTGWTTTDGRSSTEIIKHHEILLESFDPLIEQATELYRPLRDIPNTKGSITAALGVLAKPFMYRAPIAWLSGDIETFRQGHYVLGVCERLMQHYGGPKSGRFGVGLLSTLLSNEPSLIHWQKQYFIPVFMRMRPRRKQEQIAGLEFNNPRMWHLATLLAFQGDWLRLIDIADHALAHTKPFKPKFYHTDYSFFLALADGEVALMESHIKEIIKQTRRRQDLVPYVELFSSPMAVVYTKIARIHGYELDVDPKWVPPEWIDMTPASSYPLPDAIAEKFEMFAKLLYRGPYSDGNFPVDYSNASPISPDQGMIAFDQVWELLEGKTFELPESN